MRIGVRGASSTDASQALHREQGLPGFNLKLLCVITRLNHRTNATVLNVSARGMLSSLQLLRVITRPNHRTDATQWSTFQAGLQFIKPNVLTHFVPVQSRFRYGPTSASNPSTYHDDLLRPIMLATSSFLVPDSHVWPGTVRSRLFLFTQWLPPYSDSLRQPVMKHFHSAPPRHYRATHAYAILVRPHLVRLTPRRNSAAPETLALRDSFRRSFAQTGAWVYDQCRTWCYLPMSAPSHPSRVLPSASEMSLLPSERGARGAQLVLLVCCADCPSYCRRRWHVHLTPKGSRSLGLTLGPLSSDSTSAPSSGAPRWPLDAAGSLRLPPVVLVGLVIDMPASATHVL
ncbi:hypothetical protein NUW54_g9090 [Trametes sanguinea]|uniref:Uncharacterized protein n=1 Tax=Trametes sanguinea TaxID=158606 RepID=A0ACC1PAY9_9APHY|nr:hypothetical protein NUW54_g9090 [Trametes sanguinea]